ncbi:hypothetical protein pb186bvf_019644 [Paramecium bursaria]
MSDYDFQYSISQQQENDEKHTLVSNLIDRYDQEMQTDSDTISKQSNEISHLKNQIQELIGQLTQKNETITLLQNQILSMSKEMDDLKKQKKDVYDLYYQPLNESWIGQVEKSLSQETAFSRYFRGVSPKVQPLKQFSEKFRTKLSPYDQTFSPLSFDQSSKEKTISKSPKLPSLEKRLDPPYKKVSKFLPKHLTINTCLIGRQKYYDIDLHHEMPPHGDYLIIATHKGCLTCCYLEKTFREIKERANIKIARVELEKNQKFIDKYQINRFPAILYKHHLYHDIIDVDIITYFINFYRGESQIVFLKDLYHLEEFLNLRHVPSQIKIVGLFYDSAEYVDEIKQYYQLIKKHNYYKLQFAIITDSQSVKQFQQKYGTYSQLIISRFEKNLEFYDIHDKVSFLLLLDELRFQNTQEYFKSNKPIVLFVIDTVSNVTKTLSYLNQIELLAIKFYGILHFTWLDGSVNEEKLKMIGIEKFEGETIITFFDLSDQEKIIFSGNTYNITEVQLFFADYITLSRQGMFRKYQKIKMHYDSLAYHQPNTVLIYSPFNDKRAHKFKKQLKQIVSKFGNHINIKFINSTDHMIQYFYNITYMLDFNIEGALRKIQSINHNVSFPEHNLTIDESQLIDYFYENFQQ